MRRRKVTKRKFVAQLVSYNFFLDIIFIQFTVSELQWKESGVALRISIRANFFRFDHLVAMWKKEIKMLEYKYVMTPLKCCKYEKIYLAVTSSFFNYQSSNDRQNVGFNKKFKIKILKRISETYFFKFNFFIFFSVNFRFLKKYWTCF